MRKGFENTGSAIQLEPGSAESKEEVVIFATPSPILVRKSVTKLEVFFVNQEDTTCVGGKGEFIVVLTHSARKVRRDLRIAVVGFDGDHVDVVEHDVVAFISSEKKSSVEKCATIEGTVVLLLDDDYLERRTGQMTAKVGHEPLQVLEPIPERDDDGESRHLGLKEAKKNSVTERILFFVSITRAAPS